MIPFALLQRQFHDELFGLVLPFWERHGIDHEHGGFFCGLDHDGARVHDRKFHWFQGRGVWAYSFLYNHFGRDPRHLEVARRAKDFLLRHFPQPDGRWAEAVSRQGRALQPFRGDLYGMYFAVEGLQEYACAAGDQQALEAALTLWRKLREQIDRPGAPPPPQGVWMVNLLIATQLLRRHRLPEAAEMADRALDAILNRHYNSATGLNSEVLGQPELCVFGHSIECLWMAMDEALRRGDQRLVELCSQRIGRHLEAAWDREFGGLAHAVCAGRPDYEWPAERPVETGLEFRERGEFHWMKTFWAVNEVQVAALMALEHAAAPWAADFFARARSAAEERFSLKPRGYPLYLLFTDRRFSFQPRTFRQDNYHLPRQLMFNLLALERLAARAGS
jgi:mannose/cellobiose epimerase-like protein (N-acyl-D-glucosamine 2-epimerase family)